MPLDRIVLIAIVVLAGLLLLGGLLAWIAGVLVIGIWGWILSLPLAVVLYVCWKIVAERLAEHKQDNYDDTRY